MGRQFGDTVAEEANQGWGEIHRRLEAQDDERRAWLDKYVQRQTCKICHVKLHDSWHRAHPNCCPKHAREARQK